MAEERSDTGIAQTFDLWKQSRLPEIKKADFYLEIIHRHISSIEEKTKQSLSGVPLIISGMASSSIGFVDIPYSSVPFSVDGASIQTAFIVAAKGFEHDVWIVSGLRTIDDVMRGEETQLIGLIEPGHQVKNELFIFPGTHSKHISVKNNKVIDFKTYMTGEVFALLSQQSILKSAVEKDTISESASNLQSFKKGVKEGNSSNLLNTIFKARTNQLFDIYSKKENYNYLSGLLIGAELKDLVNSDAETINLVCGHGLAEYYHVALLTLLPGRRVRAFSGQQVDQATIDGHYKIGKQLKIFA
jgi:2-dehydro-3-deoxygalactonokinase